MPAPAPAPASASAPKRHLGLLFGALDADGLILLLAFGLQWTPPRLFSVTALLHDRARYADRLVRVRGKLVPRTLVQVGTPCHTQFTLGHEGTQLRVNFPECVVPDTLRDWPPSAPEVTAEGVLEPDGHFEASQLVARSYGGYEMRQHPSPLRTFKAE